MEQLPPYPVKSDIQLSWLILKADELLVRKEAARILKKLNRKKYLTQRDRKSISSMWKVQNGETPSHWPKGLKKIRKKLTK